VRDILRGVSPVESELLRLLLFVPDLQLRVVDELGPDQLPSTLARELYRAIVLQRAPNDEGVHPPFDRDALLLTLDDETRSLAQALYAVGGPMPEAREIDRLLIDLEIEQIRDLADYNEAALLEAEREGDAEAIATLMAKGRQINETRRSLDRRRDQTRLLAGPRR
jgi:23S rRNA A2030 N6-methylase RlmJ